MADDSLDCDDVHVCSNMNGGLVHAVYRRFWTLHVYKNPSSCGLWLSLSLVAPTGAERERPHQTSSITAPIGGKFCTHIRGIKLKKAKHRCRQSTSRWPIATYIYTRRSDRILLLSLLFFLFYIELSSSFFLPTSYTINYKIGGGRERIHF